MLLRLYRNHVLANLAYLLVVVLGVIGYAQLPREKQPNSLLPGVEISFELPGASAEDVEKLVVDPVELALRSKIKDIKHLYSNAQSGLAGIEIFFDDIPKPVYERRLQEVRRELSSVAQTGLPMEAVVTDVFEKTSFSGDWYKVIVYSPGDDENFRRQARRVKRDLERMPGILGVWDVGLEAPELHVAFHPERLPGLGIGMGALADTVKSYFHDVAAGTVTVGEREWLVRVLGTEDAGSTLANLPVTAAKGRVKLGELAEIRRGSRPYILSSRFHQQPAVTLVPLKQPSTNTLELIDRLKAYIDSQNRASATTGVQLFLLQDTSVHIRNAIAVMEGHAWSGLLLVMGVIWLSLGTRLAMLASLAIPFSLAGVVLFLQLTDQSLNLSVLLGVVIVLGMLVDDAVVVIEAISQYLRRGYDALASSAIAIREVWLPVFTSSLTTMASFVPLMSARGEMALLMGVVPQTVCVALFLSLILALWILPAQAAMHESRARASLSRSTDMPSTAPDRVLVDRQHRLLPGLVRLLREVPRRRESLRLKLQTAYARALIAILRAPRRSLAALLMVFVLAGLSLGFEWIGVTLFPDEPATGFYVCLEMPVGTPIPGTQDMLERMEQRVVTIFRPDELRASSIEAGAIQKSGLDLFGHQYGYIWFSLNPGARATSELIPQAKAKLAGLTGQVDIWIEGDGGVHGGKPIDISVSGEAGSELSAATAKLQDILAGIPAVHDVRIDVIPGLSEMLIRLDGEAIQRAGLDPDTVSRTLRLLADGEVVASFIDQHEQVAVRVKALPNGDRDIVSLLQQTIPGADGSPIPLSQLVHTQERTGPANISHAEFKRVTYLAAELHKEQLDTLAANQAVKQQWAQVSDQYPGVSVEFGGELQTIKEGLGQLVQKFILGLGLIFLIVGAQFRSYFTPFLILLKIPMAFAGVILGLLISREPISLYTLYGAVALSGIAVNSAILMFAAGHDRLDTGMCPSHATVAAARRRMLPILITSVTTLVGLLPLAMGGESSSTLWRPVATAIVWGVGFSTVMTLFIVPLLFNLTQNWRLGSERSTTPDLQQTTSSSSA